MERRRFRQRSTILAVLAVVLFVVACGRATEQQIDQALGITPPPTTNPTTVAEADAAAASAVASPHVDANLGIAAAGATRFQFTCQTCHSPGGGGTAPDLLASGGIGANIDYATLYPILREGEGHSPSPGPYAEFELTDDDIANIGAYIRENAAP